MKKLSLLIATVALFIGAATFIYTRSQKSPNTPPVAPVITQSNPPKAPATPPSTIPVIEPPTTPPSAPVDTPQQAAPVSSRLVLTYDQANSLSVVVNKKRQLPVDYVPNLIQSNGGQLRPEAASAMDALMSAAGSAGFSLNIISSYRSYTTQQSTYSGYVSQYGQAETDTFSARPGHSEHQTGLAADLNSLDQSFGDTPTGQWLAQNAHTYGFIIRYPFGKDSVTGYHYEPWHVRYVGADTASAVYTSGKTLDEYFGVEGGDY